jgi:hypothetical protein
MVMRQNSTYVEFNCQPSRPRSAAESTALLIALNSRQFTIAELQPADRLSLQQRRKRLQRLRLVRRVVPATSSRSMAVRSETTVLAYRLP